MTAMHYIDISETVNNQHAKDCGWKKLSDVLNKCRSFFILTKDDERKKTCGHGAKDSQTDGDDLLCKCHIMIPPVRVWRLLYIYL